MKLEWTLTLAYLRKHKKQFATSVCCLAFFIAAMVSTQLFQKCYDHWMQEERFEQYGYYTKAIVGANANVLPQDGGKKKAYGVAEVFYAIDCPSVSSNLKPYLGSLDEGALQLLNAQALEGRLPQTQGEAAIEQSTYDIMELTAKVGETVPLPVVVNGSTEMKPYRLTGILSSYCANWSSVAIATENPIDTAMPGVITLPTGETPVTSHVLIRDKIVKALKDSKIGGVVVDNPKVIGGFANSENIRLLHIMGSVLILVFAALIVISSSHVAEITLTERKNFLRLLRSLGATRRQGFRLFLAHGLCLAGGAMAGGALLGVGMLGAAVLLLNQFTFTMEFYLSAWHLLWPLLLGAAAVLAAFLLPVWCLLKKDASEDSGRYPVRRRKRKLKSFLPTWFAANYKASRYQNYLTVLLTACCMALLVFGPFYADFVAHASYQDDEETLKSVGMDYWMGLRNGGVDERLLDTEVPRGKGVPAREMEKIRQSGALRIDFYASISTPNAMIVAPTVDQTKNGAIDRLRTNASLYSQKDVGAMRDYIRYAGYPSGTDLLKPGIAGLPYEMFAQLSGNLISGKLDQAAYEQGREIAVFGTEFQVGDELIITQPVYPERMPQMNQTVPVPKIQNYTVRVGAVYSGEAKESVASKRLSQQGVKLLMSDKVLFAADPTLKYDDVCLSRTGKAEDAEVSTLLRQVKSNSFRTSSRDYTNLELERAALSTQEKSPYLLIVCIFMLTILVALMVSTTLKVKSGLRSFSLYRAIGMNRRQLGGILLLSNGLPCVLGLLLGTPLGLWLCNFISRQIPFSNAQPFYMKTVLPSVCIGAALILLLCVIACLYPKRWILRQSITEALDSVVY